MSMHRTLLIDGVVLGTRRAAAVLTRRHPDYVRRHCAAVACDVATRAALYDLDAVAAALGATPRRERMAS